MSKHNSDHANPETQPRPLRHHPFVVPVITFLVLFFLTIGAIIAINGQTVGASDTRVVNLTVDGKQQTIPTRALTVGDLLKRLNISFSGVDSVEPAADTPILLDNFNITVRHARPVTIVVGSRSTMVLTAETEPKVITQKAGIIVYPEDTLSVATGSDDTATEGVLGQKIIVERAMVVHMNLYGAPVAVRTHAKTVADLLREKHIDTRPGDIIEPSPTTALNKRTVVVVAQVGHHITTVQEEISPPTQYVDDPNMANGREVVQVAGEPGKRVVTYEIILKNGKEVGRKKLQVIEVNEPVPRVVARGTKVLLAGDPSAWLAASNISPNDYGAVDAIISRESTWRPNAINGSRCIGFGQSCGGGLEATCPNWAVDPVCQLNFFNNYAVSRYGSWQAAQAFWYAHNWW